MSPPLLELRQITKSFGGARALRGVDFDLRRDAPYSVYARLSFDVAVGAGAMGVVAL